jgi:hypothetical protein
MQVAEVVSLDFFHFTTCYRENWRILADLLADLPPDGLCSSGSRARTGIMADST